MEIAVPAADAPRPDEDARAVSALSHLRSLWQEPLPYDAV